MWSDFVSMKFLFLFCSKNVYRIEGKRVSRIRFWNSMKQPSGSALNYRECFQGKGFSACSSSGELPH
ncbi:hypothetical protein Nmel_007953 [Mimus melanotis]